MNKEGSFNTWLGKSDKIDDCILNIIILKAITEVALYTSICTHEYSTTVQTKVSAG